MSRRPGTAVAIGLATLLLAGCGGDDEPAAPPSPSGSAQPGVAAGCDLDALPPDDERERPDGSEPALRQELLGMSEAD